MVVVGIEVGHCVVGRSVTLGKFGRGKKIVHSRAK